MCAMVKWNKGTNKKISDFFSFYINTDLRYWSITRECKEEGSDFVHAPTGGGT